MKQYTQQFIESNKGKLVKERHLFEEFPDKK